MDISEVTFGMRVRAVKGHIGTVDAIQGKNMARVSFGPISVPYKASELEPIGLDTCESCQKLEAARLKAFWEGKAAGCKESEEKISELQGERDAWKRNADYWRGELEKLQKEALAECNEHIHPAIHIEDFRKKPLSEVGKFYVTCNVDASGFLAAIEETKRSLLSQKAKAVIEYLQAVGPCEFGHMVNGLDVDGIDLAGYLAEAREAGIIELVDGKYQMKEE